MSSTLAKGTRVQVTSYPSDEVKVGSTGVVVSEPGGTYTSVQMDDPTDEDGTPVLFYESELEVVAYTFKVGDKLTVLEEDSLWSGFKKGEVVEVVKFPYDASYPTHKDGTDYPFGTVQVKATKEGSTAGHYYPRYVGVTHVAKYDDSATPVREYKAGDRVVFKGVERVVKGYCDYYGDGSCIQLEDSYPSHARPDELKKGFFNIGERVRVVVDDKRIRSGEFVGKVGVIKQIRETPSTWTDPENHLPYNVEFEGDDAPHATWWVKEVVAEPWPVKEPAPVPADDEYNWLPHGTWVLYKGNALQVFRSSDDGQRKESGGHVATPLIGHYGTVEEQAKEEYPSRRWASRRDVVELVPTGPGAGEAAKLTPVKTLPFKEGDKVEVVVDDTHITTGKYVGKTGKINAVSKDADRRLKYRVVFDYPQDGISHGRTSWWVEDVKAAEPSVDGFKVGDHVVVEKAAFAESSVGKPGVITSVTSTWSPSDGSGVHPFNVVLDDWKGSLPLHVQKVSKYVEPEPEFEVGKRYGHDDRSLEYTVITVEGDKVVTWMDYPGASDYDSTTVLNASRRSEYYEV